MEITQEVIDRINALARKARQEPLTEAEAEEQSRLRAAYVAAFRRNLAATLDHTVVVDAQGRRIPVKRKTEQPAVPEQ